MRRTARGLQHEWKCMASGSDKFDLRGAIVKDISASEEVS